MPILRRDPEIKELLRTTKTIAIVGMSDRPHRDSYRIGEYLMDAGYTVIPVNPSITSALGVPARSRLDEIDTPVDMVNIFRRPEYVPAIIEAAIAINARSVWMQLGVGHQEAAERADAAGLGVVVERCILVEHRRLQP